jgi:hypothetical protein
LTNGGISRAKIGIFDIWDNDVYSSDIRFIPLSHNSLGCFGSKCSESILWCMSLLGKSKSTHFAHISSPISEEGLGSAVSTSVCRSSIHHFLVLYILFCFGHQL